MPLVLAHVPERSVPDSEVRTPSKGVTGSYCSLSWLYYPSAI